MSLQLINQYHKRVENYIQYGGSRSEQSLRNAFYQPLKQYAHTQSFDDTQQVVLIQHGQEVGRTLMQDATTLNTLLTQFVSFEPPHIKTFRDAVESFKNDLPDLLDELRKALEWVLDRYKEKKPKDPTIREKFNTYKFADYKEEVIDLLRRVCTVSVETVNIVREMARVGERE